MRLSNQTLYLITGVIFTVSVLCFFSSGAHTWQQFGIQCREQLPIVLVVGIFHTACLFAFDKIKGRPGPGGFSDDSSPGFDSGVEIHPTSGSIMSAGVDIHGNMAGISPHMND
ncbi:hypothetical protein F6X40_41330 [Paraburkholderia sp. UCT31]|uniref:hypothetical protein n=1 Tax=Paraburkholderia sp. UCT31 TaxID=2615209 RepID=UPI001655C20A|nr:hypothetical protein [Paraburkholderia sp. UCT31]MBC8742908.1 hypothetical protein [Paraburkholderia sp. UCT31]